MKKGLLLFIAFISCNLFAQNSYKYSLDLTKVKNDKLDVTLITPKITKPVMVYHFAKIIPGTYRNSDYGQFITDLKAIDKNGNPLPVKQLDTNSWSIANATALTKITYTVEDTWDSDKKHSVYTMNGTNIEEGKNYVVNTPGFFGYFEGLRNIPFEISFVKPENFYASTPLKPLQSGTTTDLFRTANLDELYDSPIMFCLPDTTTIHVGGADVLISVYSPKRKMKAAMVAQGLNQTLSASAKYLGGSLPVKRYAFIMYFNGEQNPSIAQGALEHNYSSFYTLPELPPQQIMKSVLDVTGHEFFHVLTPLNFSSKEVKEFNFEKPVLSKHLWLYEGSTEYASDHVQVKYGLNSIQEFLDKLSEKIRNSKKYNDTLAFTRLSKESATTYTDQYPNVYEKGALIAACLDLELLRLSQGSYNLQQLKHDMAVLYGKDKFFNDDELFDIITKLTFPEIRIFFSRYVEGNNPVPYAQFFSLAGVTFMPEKRTEELSLGGFPLGVSPEGKLIIVDVSKLNDFGRKMGYMQNDEVYSMQGIRITPQNAGQVINDIKSKMKSGDMLTVKVVRSKGNTTDTVELASSISPTVIIRKDVLELAPQATEQQALLRNAWLSTPERPLPAVPNLKDVGDINSIIKALYESLSGKAGPRNWERFRSLFYPGTQMSSSHTLPNGQTMFISFTFEDYVQTNGPMFEKMDFYEQELGRKVDQFNNLAIARSAYQYRFSEQGKVEQRGINNITLVRDKGRWWITNITWEDETPNSPIPQELLTK